VNKVRQDLSSKVDWDEAYSGCDVDIYLSAFSFDQTPAYGDDRSDAALASAMHTATGLAPLHGGAIVAARFALYASLVRAGAALPSGAPSANQAAAYSKRILLAWAERGYRDDSGHFRLHDSDYCWLDKNGKQKVTQFGTFVPALNLTRGVVYSADAQDLLQGLNVLDPQEEAKLNAFHGNMFSMIRNIHNEEYQVNFRTRCHDEVYNNQFVGHITSLLSIARLLGDRQAFHAALYGGSANDTIALPWVSIFDHVIYGQNDTPYLFITRNSSVDPTASHPAYSTAVVAAGEINDRYRHANPAQSMGYAMGTLTGLYMAGELIRLAGFDPYAYHGAHDQTLEMATNYYACFGKTPGFQKVVTRDNACNCADFNEYIGQVVNALQPNMLIGALRYPHDAAITEVEQGARASALTGATLTEPILFGRWRD
jgi:hypothetical protein